MLDDLKEKEFSLFGFKLSFLTVSAAFAGLSTVVGALYAGFLMYQKVEEVANLDVGAYEQRMQLIEQQVTSINENTTQIKNDLRADIQRSEDTADSAYRYVKDVNKEMNDELRSFRKDLKELEKNMEDRIQKALDNPLAN